MKIHLCLLLLLLCSCQIPQRQLNLQTGKYTYVSDNSGFAKKVYFKEENGFGVVEGDIVLGNLDQIRERNELVESGKDAILIRFQESYWTDAKVPYRLDSSIEDSTRIEQAIRHFESNTPIRFVERDRESDYVTFREVSAGCSANVGRSGGEQFVNVSSQCSLGNVIHEIGHAVGLWHEQSRADRDDHIIIHWDNISPEEKFNFNQHLTDGKDVDGYDYSSVMHYGAFAFSNNGRATITKINGSTSGIGNRTGLSAGDISALKRVYDFSRL